MFVVLFVVGGYVRVMCDKEVLLSLIVCIVCIVGVLWVYCGCIVGVLWVYCGCIVGVLYYGDSGTASR